MTALDLLTQGDGVGRAVALLLLLMSIASWVVIVWKAWLLRGGAREALRSMALFWQSPGLEEAEQTLNVQDGPRWVLPSVLALKQLALHSHDDALGARGDATQRLTRLLRDALHSAQRRLSAGQILLATVGATAPFVGLLGTVWGIHQALAAIAAQSGGFTIDKVAAPVGEALVMTALGLAVALPAVLAYNVFGRVINRIEVELEGFAHDLLAVFAPLAASQLPPARPMSLGPQA